jgi:integrase
VTQLLQRLHDELVRRHYATTTRESYLRIVRAFHRHAGGRLDRVGPDDLRRYQVYLLEERKLAVGTVVAEIAALRFFFLRVLKRRDMKEDLPYPKRRKRLPVVLSPEEVQRLIAGAKNLYHRTLLLTLYGTGLRRSEVAHLKVQDIDSERMLLRVDQGKGGRDREVPLSPTLLPALREYYREQHPWLSVQQRSVLRAIARCRTAALGGHRDRCDACGHRAISYNSCRSRHCPKCQAQSRARWLREVAADLRHLGAEIGVLSLLHTWGQTLVRNPHS